MSAVLDLILTREPTRAGVTLGTLSRVDGTWLAHTLEDAVREPALGPDGHLVPVVNWKVPGATAIPAGRYRILITMSARFKRLLPVLCEVPGFLGIRIHPGNTTADTEGCILLGQGRIGLNLVHSRAACNAVQAEVAGAIGRGEAVWVTVRNAGQGTLGTGQGLQSA